MNMSCGEAIAKMLSAEGVEKVFGIIDGTYFGLYSNFAKYGIELISPRHETTAAHMAGAYARVTGKLGVCMASNGPGAANMLAILVLRNRSRFCVRPSKAVWCTRFKRVDGGAGRKIMTSRNPKYPRRFDGIA